MLKRSTYTYLLAGALAVGTVACVPIEQQVQSSNATQSQLRYEDFVYDESIQSVQAYVATGFEEEVLEPPVVPINQTKPIILEFDRLNAAPNRLQAKLIHCDANWKPSTLSDSQFLNDFNEFFITDAQNSVSTRVNYVHYTFRVPRVKLSGNYLLVVQEEGGKLLLTQRFMVYQELVTVASKLGASLGPQGRETRQPVEFNVFYADYELVNPAAEVKAVMRQNFRWDNAKRLARPTYIHDAQRRLEYVFFEPSQLFKGLSEFRAFDTRSLDYKGVGVDEIDLQQNPALVFLQTDKSRSGLAYSQDPDINGKRIFGNRQYGNGDVNGDYTWVDFELQVSDKVPGEVYLQGDLTNWRQTEEAKLTFDAERQAYTGRMLLKQGYYNYYYTLKSGTAAPDDSYFEGSHFETGNDYDILIYYRPPGSRADLLIGYDRLYFNRK
ncbi:type IX secretion system plug protein [Pontibacter flavimaris]|uniref:Type 9 secretion system plug protein N-terminal domain-containing protein n=1 Tax=Pontibacter flavimaris TaxID=1797110 RepID=A0A1Q5PGJ9_9BACT|nr:DUF5103 domain-containing protein [Pontibacter flavimaris]OKL41354.1 hypothetical protein A3841_09825 [Pontibacter flavimaris]